MSYAFDKRYGTYKFVWYSVEHTPVHVHRQKNGNRFTLASNTLANNNQ